MQLPPFMSVDRIATLCEWPTADRRKLVKQLRLVGADAKEIDHQDQTAFWNALLPFFSSSAEYKKLSSNLKQITNKANRRLLELRTFEKLDAKAQFPRSLSTVADSVDFLSRVVDSAADFEAFGELADWLWAKWLAGAPADSIAGIIDSRKPLQNLFGSWRPPIEATDVDVPMEESAPVATEPTTADHIGALFCQVRANIDEAERLQSAEPLATALTTIEELVRILPIRKEERESLQSALAEFRVVRDRLRSREQPTDKQASTRLQKALDRFNDPAPATPYGDVKQLTDKVTKLIDAADAARSAWRECDAAHRASPFDREIRRAWNDALECYEQAEGNLAEFIESAAGEAIKDTSAVLHGGTEEPLRSEHPNTNGSAAVITPPVGTLAPGVSPNDGVNDAPGLGFVVEEGGAAPAAQGDANGAHGGPAEVAGLQNTAIETLADIDNTKTDSLAAGQKQSATGAAPGGEVATVVSGIDDRRDTEPSPGGEAGEQLAATMLQRGDIGLFEIACAAGEVLNYRLPHPNLARLLGLSGSQDAETSLRFTEALQNLPAMNTHDVSHQGETWLRLAALSLPAITDTTLLCRTALEQLKLDGPMVVEPKSLQSAIGSLGRTYPALEAFAQTNVVEAEQEFKDAKAELCRYVGRLKGSTLAYQAATVVAHKLAQGFDRIATAPSIDPNAVEAILDAVLRPGETDEALIKRLDREARGAVAERKPIEARALTRLHEMIKELRTRSARLTRAAKLLREQRMSNVQTREATHRKGQDLHRRFRSAVEAFEGLAKVQPGVNAFSAACAAVAARLLRDHGQAFETGSISNSFRQALECDRFRLPSVVRRADLTPEDTWEALRELALKPAMNWLNAFDVALDQREHLATEALLLLAIPLAHGRPLQAEREEAIVAARSHVETERARLRDDLLTVMNYAPAIETSLDPLYQGVAEIDVKELPRSDVGRDTAIGEREILDFPRALAEIAAAKKSVRRVRASALKALEDRIARLEGKVPTDTIASLRTLVEKDELITLAEEISLVERGQDIKIATPGPLAIEEFGQFLRSNESANPRLAEWERSHDFPSESRARTLIRKWLNLRIAQGDPLKRAVRDVLGELGFVPEREAPEVSSEPSVGSRIRQFSAKVRTIADREFCSVARFGSDAEGQYRIVLPSPDTRANEIVTSVSEGDAGATLVFAQKWLIPEERRAIATEAHRLGRSFCLVDDGLLAFLCTRQHVLRDLFACGIPFAAATPYVITPGSIPVEAFFGRNAEFEEIRRRNGSCIVYGGRQLGKSVLLDHIEKRSRASDKSVAIRLDCQGLTERRDILELINKKVRLRLIDSKLDILEAMEQWLDEDAERTILLMLDETNNLVRTDALRDFRLLVEFRGLMERTNRRFKVVLSGQNNVLRLTQQPNTPLAHFGQPICIGPLKGADYKAARDLVTEPLAAVGYVFESPQLVSRILVETQFYPKLVQMFCRDLLAHVRGLLAVHTTLPPWRITGDHIEATLRNQKLRKEIFETFRITLDLDKRYELVALIMAVDRGDRRKRGDIATSMTEQKLREAAFYWWPEGFSETNARVDFRGVLEELEGLGILTHDRLAGTYQLSSPIIANLIGSEAEVDDRLVAFGQELPPYELEPSKRRARLASMSEPKHKGVWVDPLTPAQISKATRAIEPGYENARPTVVFGSPDMLLDQVKNALEPKKYDEHEGLRIVLMDQPVNAASFARQLNEVKSRRCFIVSPRLQWDTAWLDTAERATGVHSVVLVGNLDHAWRVIVESPKSLQQFVNLRVETLAPLSAMEIDDQLQRRKIKLSAAERNALLAETGGFIQSLGRWTDRYLGTKRDSLSMQDVHPRFEPIPDAARLLLAALISNMQPDDIFDVTMLSLCCRDQDPARVFDWLMLSGLAEPVVRERENLRLNRVFWSPSVRKALERAQ